MCRCGLHRGHGHAGVWRMRGRGRAGVWQGRTAQNSGRIFALDGAWGAKVGLDPPKTDAIFFLLGKIEIDERTVHRTTRGKGRSTSEESEERTGHRRPRPHRESRT